MPLEVERQRTRTVLSIMAHTKATLACYENLTIRNIHSYVVPAGGTEPIDLEVCQLISQRKLSGTLNLIVPHISSHLLLAIVSEQSRVFARGQNHIARKLKQMRKVSASGLPRQNKRLGKMYLGQRH